MARPGGRQARRRALGLGSTGGALLGLLLACQSSAAFLCSDDQDCVISKIDGVCQGDGYCSFPSQRCESGQEYGQHAPSDLASMCVPVGSTGSTTGVSDSATEGESTGLPPIDDDLKIWLTFESLDGDRVLDQSGHENHADCGVMCPTPYPGVIGDGMEFSGDSMLIVPVTPELVTTDALTVTAWVRVERLDGNAMAIAELPLSTDSNPAWNSWELRLDGDGGPHLLYFATATATQQSVTVLDPPFGIGQWVHVAGVWDGVSARLYVDGAIQAESPGEPPLFDGDEIFIGAGGFGGVPNDFLEGQLDELRLYSRALAPGEILQLSEGGP